uniref:Methyltransferase n=1 Tax=OCS116 cluster bacterium TaxID=2030921 RepID=A0A2A4YSX0_9PROT
MKPTFSVPKHKSYIEGPPRMVPGYDGLLRMTGMLFAEHIPQVGRVLVLGAGGGLELKAFGDAYPNWVFDAVDPSAEMLTLAASTAAKHSERISFHEGTIEVAPEGPFDAASCILVFHHIALEQRLDILKQVHRRLKPGASFVIAHVSFPQTEPEKSQWIARHVAFGVPDGTDLKQLEHSRQAIGTRLSILSPEEDEAMLGEAGFSNISLFYAGFSFKGWVAYA